MDIAYQTEPDLAAEEFVDVLRRSTLGERRPVDSPNTISGLDLRVDRVAEHLTPIRDDRRSGFVAGRFDAQRECALPAHRIIFLSSSIARASCGSSAGAGSAATSKPSFAPSAIAASS